MTAGSTTDAITSQIEQLMLLAEEVLALPGSGTIEDGSQEQSAFIQSIMPIVAALRAEYRILSDGARSAKNDVAAVRTQVDEKLVRLQNLRYEQAKLEEEIKLTRELRSIYQDIDMESETDFLTTAPPELRTPSILADEHQLTVSRLEHELAERQRLDAERRERAKEKLALLKVDRTKGLRLKALEKAMRSLLEQAVALRDSGNTQEDG